MTKEEMKRIINRAYAKGYRMFKESDANVDEIMTDLKRMDYFQFDTMSDDCQNTVRAKLERLFKRHGFDPYYGM